jgi:hypothetical protein
MARGPDPFLAGIDFSLLRVQASQMLGAIIDAARVQCVGALLQQMSELRPSSCRTFA